MAGNYLVKHTIILLLFVQRAVSFSLYPTVNPDRLATALNISVGCLDALNTTVTCDDSLFQWTVTVDDHFWSQDNLTTLCTPACTTSAQTWELDVALACVNDDLTVYGKLVPAYTVAGRFTDGLGIACLQSATSDWCMIESFNWVGSDIIRPDCSVDPTDPSCSDPANVTAQNQRIANLYNDTLLCSDCFMKMFYQRLSSDYLPDADYSEYLVDQFQDIQDVCSTTVGNLSTRAFYAYPAATVFVANATTAPVNGSGTTPTATATSATITTSSIVTPTPTQTGMISNCDNFYQAASGDGCYSIATTHNVTLYDFETWNPDVGANCTGLFAGYYYCIGLTPSSTPTSSAIATPTPIQTGMVSSCNNFYDAVSGDSCYTIATTHNITLTDFETWNPAVGTNCATLFAGYYYCVGVVLDTISSSCQMVDTTSTGVTELNATLACNQLSLAWGVTTGDLIQFTGGQDCYSPNIVCLPPACSLIQVPANATCNSIISSLASNSTIGNVTTTQLLSWNPNIIGTCDSLLEGQYICSGAPGGSYVPPPSPTGSVNAGGQERGGPGGADPTAITGTSVSYLVTSQPLGANPTAAPAPTQIGIVSNCNQYAQAQSGDYCTAFASANKITPADLYQWNTVLGAGGANCATSFFAGYYYCIGISGSSATTPTSPPVSTGTAVVPSPTQSGIVSTCDSYAQAVSGDYCSKFAADKGIAAADLYAWNAVLGANGANCNTEFFAGYYYCVGVSGSGSPTKTATTTTSSSAASSTTAVAVPSPTQSGIVSNCNGYAEAVSGDYCYIFASNHGITTAELYAWNAVLGSNGANCGTQFFAGYYYCVSVS